MNEGIRYNVNVVNSVVADMYSASEKIPYIAEEVRATTNKILSAHGFKEHIGGVTSEMFSSPITECYSETSDIINRIKQTEVDILTYSQDGASINAFLNSLTNKDYETLDLSGISDKIGVARNVMRTIDGAFSSIGLFGLSILEGVGNLLEVGVDFIGMGVSAAESIFTLGYDLINGTDTTRQLWEDTKARVSEKQVKSIFDSLYENNSFFKDMYDNSLIDGSKVRQVGNTVGYTGGIIAANIFTGGQFSMAIGAATGFSKGAADAWYEGATLEQGLLYGTAEAAWDAAKWEAGVGVSQMFGGVGSLSSASSLLGVNTGAAARIFLSTALGASEGFVQPALTTMYKDYGGKTPLEDMKIAFEKSGGWLNVGVNGLIGLASSAGGEVYMRHKLAMKSSQEGPKMRDIENMDSLEKDNAKKVFKSFEEQYPEYAAKVKNGSGEIDLDKVGVDDLKGLNGYERTNAVYKAEELGLNMSRDVSAYQLLETQGYKNDIIQYLKDSGYTGNVDEMAETIASKIFASQNLSKIKAGSLAVQGNYQDVPGLLGYDGSFYGASSIIDSSVQRDLFRGLEEYGNAYTTRDVYFNLYDELVNNHGYSSSDAVNQISSSMAGAIEKRGFDHYKVTIDGVEKDFYVQKGMRATSTPDVTIEDLAKQLESLPEGMRRLQPDVYMYDTFNPDDIYWTHNPEYAASVKGGRFSSSMTGGANDINVYNCADDPATIIHEMGHVVDKSSVYGRLSRTSEWKTAMDADFQLTNKPSYTPYGASNAGEDFAESMQFYFTDHDNFVSLFPNRAKYLEELLKGLN